MNTRQTAEHVAQAAQRLVGISTAAAGRDLTSAQKRDWASASAELIGLGDEVRSAGGYVAQVYDRLGEALADGDTEVASRTAGELTRHFPIDGRAHAADESRGAFGSLFTGSGESYHGSFDFVDAFQRAQRGEHVQADLYYDTRALQSLGGSAVPTTFIEKVVTYQRTLTPMFDPSIVSLIPTKDGRPITLPRLTADPAMGGTIVAEAAGITELDPTISSVQLDAYKYAIITNWSSELDADNVIAIENVVAKSIARELALDAGSDCTVGNGSSKPNGFITAALNGGTAAGTAGGETFLGWEDLVTLYGGLAAPYQANGTWMVAPTMFTKILKFRTTDGLPVFNPGLAGAPGTLMGRPLVINPAMAAVASASKSVAFGDFSAYHVRRVVPLRIELSKDYKWATDQISLRVVDRLDGDLVDEAAIAFLVSANT